MDAAGVKTIAISAAVVVVGVLAWRASKTIGQAADAAGQLLTHELNPASPDNLAYGAVNGIGGAIAGEPDWTLGGWLYDVTHADPLATMAADEATRAAAAAQAENERLARRYPAPTDGAWYDPLRFLWALKP